MLSLLQELLDAFRKALVRSRRKLKPETSSSNSWKSTSPLRTEGQEPRAPQQAPKPPPEGPSKWSVLCKSPIRPLSHPRLTQLRPSPKGYGCTVMLGLRLL